MAENEEKKTLEQKPQKELMRDYHLWTTAYLFLTFVGPLLTVIIMFSMNGSIQQKWKVPFAIIITALAVIFAAVRFFKKAISKISILNIDGTYNTKNQKLKHGLEFLGSAIIPCTLIIVSVLMITKLQEFLVFYQEMVLSCLSFFLVGIMVDKLVIAFYDDEIALREQVKNANAIERRKNSLM